MQLRILGRKTILLLATAAVAFIGCRGSQQTSPVAEEPEVPPGFEPFTEKILTSTGKNQKGVFAPDGKSVYYLSSDRTSHSHWQVYQLFLQNGDEKKGPPRERRVTWSDGVVESLGLSDGKRGKIYYSSSTDEIKEMSNFIQVSLNINVPILFDFFGEPLPRTEVYESDVNGDHIERLTESPGFDGDLAPRVAKGEVVFVSSRDGNPDIFIHHLKTGKASKIVSEGEPEWAPAVSTQNELAYVRGFPKERIAQIYVAEMDGGNPRAVTTEKAIHTDPVWSSDGKWIIFSANMPDPLNFELYRIQKDGQCLERLTYTAAHERYPQLHSNGKSLLFTRVAGDERHIILVSDLSAPNPKCPSK